ncbi:MAG: pyridoxamine 5'-phosphate oxidase family protein [Solirubrobacteraceae bacterium]|nr:pyridoxamine 5'-phosphate oxidase family protein [Solirubrobacteraceae bacterium]
MSHEARVAASLGRPLNENHSGADHLLQFPPPLGTPELGARRSAAEEARTVAAQARLASLATAGDDGHPWSSIVGYGLLEDGSLSLVLSQLAEHGRNVAREPRVSVSLAAPVPAGADPLDASRVTLSGRLTEPTGSLATAALDAHCAAYPAARAYARFGDFALYVLSVEKVRWVGGFGRMGWADGADYARAEADPTADGADDAARHLNIDHADALLVIAQEIAGYHDATAATCDRIDRYGLDLTVRTLRGPAPARVSFAARADDGAGLRAGCVDLTRRARARRAGAAVPPADAPSSEPTAPTEASASALAHPPTQGHA